MKKLLLVSFALFSFVFNAQAQDIKFGVKGGLNLASINTDDLTDTSSRTGYHIGLVAQFSLLDMFAIQPEVMYSAQGWDDLDIDYLNVPILFKYKVAKVLSFEAGPQFGIAVNDGLSDVERAFLGDIKDLDISGAVGAGVEFGKFFGQLRYNFGFTEIFEGIDAKNGNFQVSVGYYIF